MGCVVPRGPPKHSSAGLLGASYRRGVTKDARPHLRKGHRFDLVDDGTRSRGRGGLDVMGFFAEKSRRAHKKGTPRPMAFFFALLGPIVLSRCR